MIKEKIVFNSKNVLKPQFIANCVQVACDFKSKVFVKTNDKTVNAKSLMGMMGFDFENIQEFYLETDGEDESQAFSAIKELLV